MFFVILLMLSTAAIAFSAAFFSVYGLANTFTGVFWSVVVMGASLEAGKLVATSYLYRYWEDTHVLLKGYLMAGVAVLMLLTSMGIFGYLSSGYQTDMLPLQQINSQIKILDEEKARKIERKKQIDDLIAKAPGVTNLQRGDQTDARTLQAFREANRARDALVNQNKAEQAEVTRRVNEIDKEILGLRQQQIKSEAHVGPIVYIAKAFEASTDDATKWIIFMIIFAFDPMAVALTLALNIVIRKREEETQQAQQSPFDTKNVVNILPTEMSVNPDLVVSPRVHEIVDSFNKQQEQREPTPPYTFTEQEIVDNERLLKQERVATPPPSIEKPHESIPLKVGAPYVPKEDREQPKLYPIPGDMAMPAPDVQEEHSVEEPSFEQPDTELENLIEYNLSDSTEENAFVKEIYENDKGPYAQGKMFSANVFNYPWKMTLEQKLAEINRYYQYLLAKPSRTDLEQAHMVRASGILKRHNVLK